MTYGASASVQNSATVTVPSGSTGDILVAYTFDVTAAPGGYTQRATHTIGGFVVRLWTKTRTGSEGASHVFTSGGTFPIIHLVNLTGGVDEVPTLVAASGTFSNPTGSDVTAPNSGTLLFCATLVGEDLNGTPSGMTLAQQVSQDTETWYQEVSAGSTGTRTLTPSGTGANWGTFMAVFAAAGPVAVVTPPFAQPQPLAIGYPYKKPIAVLQGIGYGINRFGARNIYVLTAQTGDFALTGNAATLRANRRVAADNGSFTLTGNAAALRANRQLPAATGSFTLTGNNAGLSFARRLTAGAGSFTLTGNDAALRAQRRIVAAPGSFALTGSDAALRATRRLTAATGMFTLTGTDATLRALRRIVASAGSFTLTGNAADLIYVPSGGGGSYTLVANGGVFALTGGDASLRVIRRLVAEPGSFTLTGNAATLARRYTLVAAPGSFALTGYDAAMSRTRRLVAQTGTFTLTGYPANISFSGDAEVEIDGATLVFESYPEALLVF